MKILLVDDEQEFIKILTVAFQVYRPGYTLIAAYTGEEGLAKAEAEAPDLVVLDVMLPDIDGFEVCRRLRAQGNIPIILLTAKDREEDIVQGLEVGADDYITKPFSYRTLMARIDALLRRTGAMPGAERPGLFRWGDLTVDFTQRQVRLRGKIVDLTVKEYRILEELARQAGQVVSHQTLLVSIWGDQYRDEPQYLKTYMYRLRRKLEDDARHPRYILTHYGDGYRLGSQGRGQLPPARAMATARNTLEGRRWRSQRHGAENRNQSAGREVGNDGESPRSHSGTGGGSLGPTDRPSR